VEPEVVGNDMKILVTEMAGRASIELKSRELGLDLSAEPDALTAVTNSVKQLEAAGWSFEAADASFELLVRSALPGGVVAPFHLESYRVIVEHRSDGEVVSEATVKLRVRGERVISTAEGNGPVNALDNALRSGLRSGYPEVDTFELADYKVRILAGSHGTGAITRVLVDTAHSDAATADGTTDGNDREWTTVGVHENVVEASWHALVDALTYGLSAPADVAVPVNRDGREGDRSAGDRGQPVGNVSVA
jgi:2-isopropylmalate synthase